MIISALFTVVIFKAFISSETFIMYKSYTTAIHSQRVVPLDRNVDISGKYRRSTLYCGRVLMNYATMFRYVRLAGTGLDQVRTSSL